MTNVVLVDDEEEILELFPLLFADRADVDFHTFGTHSTALDYLNSHNVDVLMVDYRMEDGTAIDFFEAIPEAFSGKRYIVTGELGLSDEVEAEVDGVISKPFRKDSFAGCF